MNPEDLRYADSHEWVRVDGEVGTIGITDHAQKQAGVPRRLVGFEMVDRGIGRHGYPAKTAAGPGLVTSGTHSPTLGKPIGLALLPTAAAAVGTEFSVEIRGRDAAARVVETPFYKRSK